jgi:N-acetylglucosamine kinase-like BadF-type ATPase
MNKKYTKHVYVLGVDGGGTSTVARLADGGGRILGAGRAGASNAKAVGWDAASRALAGAISAAFADAGVERSSVAAACLGLAGFDRPEDRRILDQWNQENQWCENLIVRNDGELVIAAGTPSGSGIGVIAGTGSIAVGILRDDSGRVIKRTRAGGWGHVFGDEGSAYGVAIAALRLTARRADGRSAIPAAGDPLTKRILNALNIDQPSGIIGRVYGGELDRSALAALAPDVVAAVEEGDEEAGREILDRAGRDLGETAAAVAANLGLFESENSALRLGAERAAVDANPVPIDGERRFDESACMNRTSFKDFFRGPIPLALAGGFLLATPRVRRALIERLVELGIAVDPREVPEPVVGAVRIALDAIDKNETILDITR